MSAALVFSAHELDRLKRRIEVRAASDYSMAAPHYLMFVMMKVAVGATESRK
jgi:hypothetical protein